MAAGRDEEGRLMTVTKMAAFVPKVSNRSSTSLILKSLYFRLEYDHSGTKPQNFPHGLIFLLKPLPRFNHYTQTFATDSSFYSKPLPFATI